MRSAGATEVLGAAGMPEALLAAIEAAVAKREPHAMLICASRCGIACCWQLPFVARTPRTPWTASF
jgi:hypothetical protein